MKAIRVRYMGQSSNGPAKWVAEDGDGNRVRVNASSHTKEMAAEALCKKMGWVGELIAGGFKNDEFFVFADSSSRIRVGTLEELTDAQYAVIVDIRQRGCYGTAEAIERHWRKGEHYYIDTRVNIPKRLRKRFDAINNRLLEEANTRFESEKGDAR